MTDDTATTQWDHGIRWDCNTNGCTDRCPQHGLVQQLPAGANAEAAARLIGQASGHAMVAVHRLLVAGPWTDDDDELTDIAAVPATWLNDAIRHVLAHTYTDDAVDAWLAGHTDDDPTTRLRDALATLSHHAT